MSGRAKQIGGKDSSGRALENMGELIYIIVYITTCVRQFLGTGMV